MSPLTAWRIVLIWAFLTPLFASGQEPTDGRLADPDRALADYRDCLRRFRAAHGPVRALPPVRFYLLGMGDRRKLIYARGRLVDARTGDLVQSWDVDRDWILPDRYAVVLRTVPGELVRIVEDEEAVWLEAGRERRPVERTRSATRLNLPAFEGRDAAILRVLHQEILINIVDGKPLPNFLVYSKPWYRDGAMVAMVLKRTGNLHLIRDWILGLRETYDRNNAGEREADNPGQALFLISLVANRDHPLVPGLLREMEALRKGSHIEGRSDFAPHPVYQTRWAKLGLASLGLPDSLVVPEVRDSYSRLCWWSEGLADHPERKAAIRLDYPYLTWAEAHSLGLPTGPIGDQDYPLTWEANASQADYSGMTRIDPGYVGARLCVPHTWHAAEAFLAIDPRPGARPGR